MYSLISLLIRYIVFVLALGLIVKSWDEFGLIDRQKRFKQEIPFIPQLHIPMIWMDLSYFKLAGCLFLDLELTGFYQLAFWLFVLLISYSSGIGWTLLLYLGGFLSETDEHKLDYYEY
jgi:hypothetical protein